MQANMDKDMLAISKEWLELRRVYIKYSTYIKYKRLIELQLTPFFQEYHTQDINEQAIVKFLKKKMDGHYSFSTMASIRFTLKSILNYGEYKYGIPHIDFQFIKLTTRKEKTKVLTSFQIQCLDHYCFHHIDSTSIAITLGLYAGLRIGEICALQWKDIDLSQGVINISKTVQRLENADQTLCKTSLMIFEPKSETSKRQVPLPNFMLKHIYQYYQLSKDSNENAFILSNNSRIIDPRTIQYRFKKICSENGFSINFHSLRHTYATKCVESGIEIKSLSEILGHSDISITLNRYVHSSLRFKQDQINKMKQPSIS
ncbi:tyrosine-type recombinase/integrase [Beduini massiliensis]|uniref:tyrosine-type recombinase/integrase n=1 Tax=Beduini massiliensis TaxID=1585974 RepID=UPI0006934A32|nr:site-specific integrase [Beduini massiliensis]